MSFAGKVALVAGAGGGMGLNIANDLIAAGARVVLADIKDPPADIAAGPGEHRYRQGDLSEEAFVNDLVAETADGGRLDLLVNATGVLWLHKDKSLVEMAMEDWDRIHAINLKSYVMTARAAIPRMKTAGGGAMVHIASVDGLRGDDRPQDAYGSSKAAIVRLSKSIAVQFAGDGIRSNAVLPGPVLSPMQERWDGKPDLQAQVAGRVPLGRLGTTQDQADACLFLLSDRASFITGTELIVDGGLTALP